MPFVLYLVTAATCLWLVHRSVVPVSRAAALVLLVLPMTIVGYALVIGGVYGPVDHAYQFEPLSAFAGQFGIGEARNPSAVDIWSEFYPWRQALRESYARGEWPLWNAYNLAGHPLAAEAQTAPYSPFTLLALLLPPMPSQTYSLAMALFLAGVGAFVFARELGCGEGAALIAAAGWGLSSCLGSRLTAMGFATAFAPLLLAATRRVITSPGVRSGALLMVTLALTTLAGHPESLFLNVLVGCAYGFFELVRHRSSALRAIATAVVAGMIALLLCAIFILPLVTAIPQSHEYLVKHDAYAEVKRGVSGPQVLAWLAANVFPQLQIRRWVSPNLGYIGAEVTPVGSILLALAIYAVWRRRSSETWFFAGLAAFCLLAGARWGPIADTLQRLPLLNITFHDRLAFHGALCLIVLATLGADHLLRVDDRRAPAMTMLLVLVLLALGTWWIATHELVATTSADFGRYRVLAELLLLPVAAALIALRPRLVLPALLAVVISQLAFSNIDTFATYPAAAAFPKVPMLEPLRKIREPFRVVGVGLAMPPATNTFYGLEDVRGYEALTLEKYVSLSRLWSRRHGIWFNRADDLTSPLLALMNVRFAVQSDALPVPQGWRVAGSQQGALLLENPAALERIFIPARVVLTGASTDEIVDRMAQVRDFRSVAWISTGGESGERPNGPGRITLRSYSRGGEYVFDADMEGDGYVVVSDSAWRGWYVHVDGAKSRPIVADAAFLGVFLARGHHTVRLVYRPVWFERGRAITFVTLALLLVAAVVWKSRHTALMRILGFAFLLLTAVPMSAQFGVTVDVEVLEIEAVVLDADGNPVPNLRAEDFEVRLDGVKVQVGNFYSVSGGTVRDDETASDAAAPARTVPTRLVIFIDEMHLGPTQKGRTLAGLRRFVETLNPSTTAMIVRWVQYLDVIVPATSDRVALLKGIDSLSGGQARFTPDRDRQFYQDMADAGVEADVIAQMVQGDMNRMTSDSFATLSGLRQALGRMEGMDGRKVLLYVSTGLPMPSLESGAASTNMAAEYRELFQTAQRSGIVFSMFHPGLTQSRMPGHQQISDLAAKTGGTIVRAAADIPASLAKMTNQLTTYYSLGVTPRANGKAAKVEVRVPGHPQYRVMTAAERETRSRDERLDGAVRAHLFVREEVNPLGVGASVAPPRADAKGCRADLAITIPASKLTLVPEDGKNRAQLAIRVVMLDDREGESPVIRRLSRIEPRPDQALRTVMPLKLEGRKYVLSLAVTDGYSGETTYLQRDVDARRCR